MALTKRTETEVTAKSAYKHLSVRVATIIEEDGVEISRTFHRGVAMCGNSDAATALGVTSEADFYWTAEVVQAYNDSL